MKHKVYAGKPFPLSLQVTYIAVSVIWDLNYHFKNCDPVHTH